MSGTISGSYTTGVTLSVNPTTITGLIEVPDNAPPHSTPRPRGTSSIRATSTTPASPPQAATTPRK